MNVRNWITAHKYRLIGLICGILVAVAVIILVGWAIEPAMLEDTPGRVLMKQRLGVIVYTIVIGACGVVGWFIGGQKE